MHVLQVKIAPQMNQYRFHQRSNNFLSQHCLTHKCALPLPEQLCAQLLHNSTDENDRNKRPLFGTKSIAIPFSDNFPLPLAKSLVRSLKTLQPSPNSSVVATF